MTFLGLSATIEVMQKKNYNKKKYLPQKTTKKDSSNEMKQVVVGHFLISHTMRG